MCVHFAAIVVGKDDRHMGHYRSQVGCIDIYQAAIFGEVGLNLAVCCQRGDTEACSKIWGTGIQSVESWKIRGSWQVWQ